MKAQAGMEYMVIIGFVSFAVTVILLTSYFYVNLSKDRIRENQIEILASKILNSAESVYYAGEPSQITLVIYVPSGVNSIEFSNYDMLISTSTSSGISKRAFTSKVMLQGNISNVEGVKKLKISAGENAVIIA